MPFIRTPELVGFQRWVIGAYDKGISWEAWSRAKYNPRKLSERGPRRLEMFGECTVPGCGQLIAIGDQLCSQHRRN